MPTMVFLRYAPAFESNSQDRLWANSSVVLLGFVLIEDHLVPCRTL